MEERIHKSERQMKIDGRRSKEAMLEELLKVLGQRAQYWTERMKNQYAFCENTTQAGHAEAYASARTLLKEILAKGK